MWMRKISVQDARLQHDSRYARLQHDIFLCENMNLEKNYAFLRQAERPYAFFSSFIFEYFLLELRSRIYYSRIILIHSCCVFVWLMCEVFFSRYTLAYSNNGINIITIIILTHPLINLAKYLLNQNRDSNVR